MSSALRKLLEDYRSGARTEREKGTYFEELAKVFFENDPQYAQRFDNVWAYADFAKERGTSGQDSRSIMDADITEESKLNCELEHVDGSYNAKARNTLLNWLKEDAGEDNCRILSNARCLSEGVDVPALDAIMFLHPRKSQIDVVQSVGRVMRRAPGKKMGYVSVETMKIVKAFPKLDI